MCKEFQRFLGFWLGTFICWLSERLDTNLEPLPDFEEETE